MGNKGALIGLVLVGGAVGAYFLLRKRGRKAPENGKGDINYDGYVTEADAELVSQYIVGAIDLNDEQLWRADVNGDGLVNSADLLLIKKYIAGTLTEFPT